MYYINIFILFLLFYYAKADSEVWPLKTSATVYYQNDSTGACDLLSQPCLPLSDVWGLDIYTNTTANPNINTPTSKFAFVATVNGVDIVDLTQTTPIHSGFLRSCLSEDRYILSYYSANYSNQALYSVTDVSPLCQCMNPNLNCSLQLKIQSGNAITNVPSVWVPISAALTKQPLTARALMITSDSCLPYSLTESNIVVVSRSSNCSIATQIVAAQQSFAAGIIIVNYRNDVIFSKRSLLIDSDLQGINITIPALFVASSNISLLQYPNLLTFDPSNLASSQIYSKPSGLTVIDLRPLAKGNPPILLSHIVDWFNFSSRMSISPPDPYAYIVGVDTIEGGLIILGLTDPYNPVLLGSWMGAALTDVTVITCPNNAKLAFCVATDSNQVFVIDVTDPTTPTTAFKWNTPFSPHSSAPDPTCAFLYVVYEGRAMPSDVFTLPPYTHTPLSNTTNTTIPSPTINPDRSQFYFPSNLSPLPQEIITYGQYLYIADSGLSVFSLDNPQNPSLVARTGSYASTTFVATSGIYARSARNVYLVDNNRGLFVLQYEDEVIEQVNLVATSLKATVAAALLAIIMLTAFWVMFVLFRLEHWIK